MDGAEWRFRVRLEREKDGGRGEIRRPFRSDELLPCVWTECDRPARREHLVAMRDGEKPLFHFFCSGTHRNFWLHSHHDHGNLPSGSKSTVG